MSNRLILSLLVLSGCSSTRSSSFPDYASTRINVNTGTSQGAAEESKRAEVEIKNTLSSIKQLQAETALRRQEVEASRIRIQKN